MSTTLLPSPTLLLDSSTNFVFTITIVISTATGGAAAFIVAVSIFLIVGFYIKKKRFEVNGGKVHVISFLIKNPTFHSAIKEIMTPKEYWHNLCLYACYQTNILRKNNASSVTKDPEKKGEVFSIFI